MSAPAVVAVAATAVAGASVYSSVITTVAQVRTATAVDPGAAQALHRAAHLAGGLLVLAGVAASMQAGNPAPALVALAGAGIVSWTFRAYIIPAVTA